MKERKEIRLVESELIRRQLRQKCGTVQSLFHDLEQVLEHMQFEVDDAELRAMTGRVRALGERFSMWTWRVSLRIPKGDGDET